MIERPAQAHGNQARSGAEIDGVLDELVEHLDDQVRRAPHETGVWGRLELESHIAKTIPVSAGRRDQQFAQIEVHAFRLFDALLDPRRRSQSAQDRLQALGAVARTRDILSLVLAHPLGFQIIQRGANDGERRAQFVGKLAAQRPQVLRVLVKARQQALETTRQGADFVLACCFGHIQADFPIVAHRGIGGGAQAPYAQADPGGEAEHDDHRQSGGRQGEVEQARQRVIPQVQQLIAGLLEHHGAARMAADDDGGGCRQQ